MAVPWLRVSRSVGVALAVGTLVVTARMTGLLEGFLAVAATGVMLLALPTSRALSRRVLLLGAMLAGLAPLMWLAPVPTAGLGRTVLLLTLVSAGLAGWAAWAPAVRLRMVVPRLAVVDAIPALAAAVAITANLPWLRATDAAGALSMLQAGWDNSAHFSMTRMIRVLGHTYESSQPLANGESLKFTDYPQGFHALAASLMELMIGQRPSTVAAEVVTFSQAVGLIATGAVVLVAAAVCSVPALRRRPAVALPATALPVAFFALGPGGQLVASGFVNFYLACALCVACAAIALQMPRIAMPVQLGALLGALLGVTYGWVLLLALALPASVLVLVPFDRSRWRGSRRAWTTSGALLALAALAAIRAALALAHLDADDVLVIDGTISPPRLSLTAGIAVVAIITALASAGRGSIRDRLGNRATWLALVPALGLMVAVAIAALQLTQTGGLSYYFWKFAYGLLLVSAAVTAIAGALVAISLLPAAHREGRARRRRWGLSILVSFILTQAFGLTGAWGANTLPTVPRSIGTSVRADIAARYAAPLMINKDLVAAASIAALDPTTRFYVILPTGVAVLHPLSAAQWAFALSGTWTTEANAGALPLVHLGVFPDEAAQVIDQLLGATTTAVVLTDARTMDLYLESDRPAEVATRIRTW